MYRSQIPSQPAMMNQSPPGLLARSVTSGLEMIICYSYDFPLFCLQLKSPKLRDRFNPPFTLPFMIYPPALFIRFFSISFSGLWSKDKGTAVPLWQSTLLESPAFAVNIFVEVIRITLAVQPVPIETTIASELLAASNFFRIIFSSSSPSLLQIIQSTLRKVSIRASLYLSSLQAFEAFSCVRKIRSTYLATSRPDLVDDYLRARRKQQKVSSRSRCPPR